MYDYKARFYDPQLGRFAQADSLIPDPGNVLAWDHFSYVYNNPVRYTDPSGHMLEQGAGGGAPMEAEWWWKRAINNQMTMKEKLLEPQIWVENPYQIGPGTSTQSQPSLDNRSIDDILLFFEKAFTPFNKFVEGGDLYELTGKGGYRAFRYALPTRAIEAGIAGYRQWRRDSWYESLNSEQRVGRIIVSGAETYLTDLAAGWFGGQAVGSGGLVGGPIGAGSGYFIGSAYATNTMERTWAYLNFWFIYPSLNLGAFP